MNITQRWQKVLLIGLLLAIGGVALFIFFVNRGRSLKNSSITTSFSNIKSLPDPAGIVTTSEWYFLNHVSSALVMYNHQEGRFNPLLAEKWAIQGNTITFFLSDSAKFSDGSALTAKDVAYTIKRLILKRTSTHFPVWDQLTDCSSLKAIDENCPGISIVDEKTIKFLLSKTVESFFLLMASPEGGIWHWKDIGSDLEIKPSKFSGPYVYIAEGSDGLSELKQNPYSIIQKNFPEAPKLIRFYSASGTALENLIQEKRIDLFMEPVRPYFAKIYEEWGYKRNVSVYSTILYLSKVGSHSKAIGKSFFEKLWAKPLNEDLSPAESVLPFGSLGALNRKDFLGSLPDHSTSGLIRIAILSPYFRPELADLIREAAKDSATKVEIVEVDFNQWVELNGKKENDSKFDFVFTIYVASERYPSVQIRFLLDGRVPPFPIEDIDQPDFSASRKASLAKLETWMISSQNILPLFFTRTHIVSKPNIEVGVQPISDAEIQLWRVKKIGDE